MATQGSTGFQQITSLSGSTALTVPAGTHEALLQATGQNVRYKLDGNAPTAAIGLLIIAGAEKPTKISGGANLANARFIEAAGSAVLNVQYLGVSSP